MKRRYEVSYYELGLTRWITRKFFTSFFADLWAWWINRQYGEETKVKIRYHE